ncbi:MAG: helix-turn-helix domain-containing protein [Spirochaetota bacterium]
MDGIRDQVAQNIKYYRTLLHWSQEDLAEKAGLSPGMIGKIEARISSPSLDSLSHIARALNVEPYLLVVNPQDRSNSDTREIDSMVHDFKMFLHSRSRQ